MPRLNSSILVALALTLGTTSAFAEGFALAHHKSNSGTIDTETLRKAFTGRLKQWDNGAVVQPVLITNEDAPETKYLASTLGMTPRELLNRIQQEVFRGEMRRPTAIKSSADCVSAVRGNPGALCVIVDSAAAGLPPDVVATAFKK